MNTLVSEAQPLFRRIYRYKLANGDKECLGCTRYHRLYCSALRTKSMYHTGQKDRRLEGPPAAPPIFFNSKQFFEILQHPFAIEGHIIF